MDVVQRRLMLARLDEGFGCSILIMKEIFCMFYVINANYILSAIQSVNHKSGSIGKAKRYH